MSEGRFFWLVLVVMFVLGFLAGRPMAKAWAPRILQCLGLEGL